MITLLMAVGNTTILTATWGHTKVVSFAVFLIVIDVLAIFGNILVILVIFRTKELRRRESSYFLVSLSIADLLVALTVIPVTVASLINPHVLNDFVKHFLGFGNFTFCICSIMSLTLLSLDRYFAIVFPYRYLEMLTHKRACFLCILSWLYSMGFSLPPAFGISSYFCFIPNLDNCSNEVWRSFGTLIFAILVLGSTYVLSLIAMGLAYWKIFKVTRFHSRKIAAQCKTSAVDNHHSRYEATTSGNSEKREGLSKPTPMLLMSLDTKGDDHLKTDDNLHASSFCSENEQSIGPSRITAMVDKPNKKRTGEFKNKKDKNSNESSFSDSTKNEIRVAKSFLTIVGFYFLCWTPFCLILMIELIARTKLTDEGSLICLWIGYINSCLNPFIHTWKYKQFRDALIKFLNDVKSTVSSK